MKTKRDVRALAGKDWQLHASDFLFRLTPSVAIFPLWRVAREAGLLHGLRFGAVR